MSTKDQARNKRIANNQPTQEDINHLMQQQMKQDVAAAEQAIQQEILSVITEAVGMGVKCGRKAEVILADVKVALNNHYDKKEFMLAYKGDLQKLAMANYEDIHKLFTEAMDAEIEEAQEIVKQQAKVNDEPTGD